MTSFSYLLYPCPLFFDYYLEGDQTYYLHHYRAVSLPNYLSNSLDLDPDPLFMHWVL